MTRKRSSKRASERKLKERDLYALLNLDPVKESDREKFDNDAVRKVILRFPDAAKPKQSFKSEGRGYSIHVLPWVIGLGASIDVVELLYKAYPEAIQKKDSTVSTPLHYASFFSAPFGVVKFLIDRYPEAAKELNQWEDLPLHCACWRETSFSVIRLLMETHPKAIDEKNINGTTPLILAQSSKKSPEVIKMLTTLDTLLNANPSDEEVVDMLREQSEGVSWRSRTALVLNVRGSVLHELHLNEKLLPTVVEKIGQECRVQAMYFLLRGLPSIFDGRNLIYQRSTEA